MPRVVVAIATVASVLSVSSARAQGLDLQGIVDQFYPGTRLHVVDAEQMRSCHGVYETSATGEPSIIVAGYTNSGAAMMRVLVRTPAGPFEVAAESPESLAMFGSDCSIEFLSLSGSDSREILLNLDLDSAGWVFRWSQGQLLNLTPTEQDEEGQAWSRIVNFSLVDVLRDGTTQIYAVPWLPPSGPRATYTPLLFRSSEVGYVPLKEVVVLAFPEVFPSTAEFPYFVRFLLPPSVTGPYSLRVINGDAAGHHRVRALSVRINGAEVLGLTHVNREVEFADVALASSLPDRNRLDVTMDGELGDYLILMIEQVPPQ
jgi:hypothetical protein